MEPEMKQRFDTQDAKLQAIYKSVEKTRRYFQIVMWVSIGAIILPIIGLAIVIPRFLKIYTDTLGGF